MIFLKDTSSDSHRVQDRKTIFNNFITSLFSNWKQSGLNYCVLRNYLELPDAFGNDIDLLVDKADLNQFKYILTAEAEKSGLKIVKNVRRFGYESFWFCSYRLSSIIHFDIWTRIDVKGICWLDTKSILERKKLYNNIIYIPDEVSSGIMLLLKDVLQTGKFRSKYIHDINEVYLNNQEKCFHELRLILGFTHSQLLCNALDSGNWDYLDNNAAKIKRSFYFKALLNNPLRAIYGFFNFLAYHFLAAFSASNGIFIVLVGPDGSGKSSMYNYLMKECNELFKVCKYYHGRFFIIPSLGDLAKGRLNRKKEKSPDFAIVIPENEDVPYSTLKTLIYVLYYYFDFLLGYLPVIKSRKYGQMIVFDRYFYDYIIQPSFAKCPKLLLRFLARIIPEPDLLVYLKCDPKIIQSRKPELKIDNIIQQQKTIETHFSNYKNFVAIDTLRDVKIAGQELLGIIKQNMIKKRK